MIVNRSAAHPTTPASPARPRPPLPPPLCLKCPILSRSREALSRRSRTTFSARGPSKVSPLQTSNLDLRHKHAKPLTPQNSGPALQNDHNHLRPACVQAEARPRRPSLQAEEEAARQADRLYVGDKHSDGRPERRNSKLLPARRRAGHVLQRHSRGEGGCVRRRRAPHARHCWNGRHRPLSQPDVVEE